MNWRKVLCAFGIAFLVPVCLAQDITDVEAKPYGSYTGGAIDTVDLATGNLMLNIPLVSFPQRGTLPPLSFSVELNNAPYTQGGWACDPNNGPVTVYENNPYAIECAALSSRYDTSPPGAPYTSLNSNYMYYTNAHNIYTITSYSYAVCQALTGYYSEPCGIDAVWGEEDNAIVQNVGAYLTSSFSGGIVTGQFNFQNGGSSGNGGFGSADYEYNLIDPSGTTHELESDAALPNTFRAPDGSGYTFVPLGGNGYDPGNEQNYGEGTFSLQYSDGINPANYWLAYANALAVENENQGGVRLGAVQSPTGIQYTDTIVSFAVPSYNQAYPCSLGFEYCIPRALVSTASDPAGNTITRGPWYWSGYYSLASSNAPFGDIQSFYNSLTPQGPYYIDSNLRRIPDAISMQATMYGWQQIDSTHYSMPWTVPGPNGSSVTYVIKYTQIGNAISWNGQGTPDPATDIDANGWAISSVTLPNNTSWQFTYSGPDLQSITTPSGGTITYTYAAMTNGENAPVGTSRCNATCHAVQTRVETDGLGSNVPGQHSWTTNYTYNTLASLAGCSPIQASGEPATLYAFSTTETDPLGNDTVHSFCGMPSGFSVPAANQYHEVKTDYYQGSSSGGTWLKTVATSYEAMSDISPAVDNSRTVGLINVLPTQITTTTPSGTSTDIRQYSHDNGTVLFNAERIGCIGNDIGPGGSYGCSLTGSTVAGSTTIPISYLAPTTESTQDESGNILRTTKTTFEFQSPLSQSYTGANLIALPLSVSVSGAVNDASGTTTYKYDESSYESLPGAYGNQTSKTDSYTMVQGWSPTSVTTHTAYNSSGMPVTKIDGRGYPTQITYDSTGIFPYEIQHPTTANGVSHIDYYWYDPTTGDLDKHKDENGEPTTYSYDQMGRITSIGYPDGGGSSFCYTDSGTTCSLGGFEGSVPFSLYTNTTAAPDPAIATLHSYDGWGRQYQSVVLSDPLGATTVNTTYDWAGRVASVTNPFRSTSNSTDGTTSYTYDALGRKTIQTQPDGNMQKWCYDGIATNSLLQGNCLSRNMQYGSYAPTEWTDVWDETGRHSQQVFDALGRMGSVIEPDPSSGNLAMETDYSYNLYGDLMQVNQYGHATTPQVSRYFWYDMPGRVTIVQNPETTAPAQAGQYWQNISAEYYVYDANNNRTQMTDGRGVTTTYLYDALNRLTSKTYTGDSSGAPSSCYQYDGSHTANLSGRLVAEWTQKGTCSSSPSSGALTQTLFSSYDQMGRVTSKQQCVLSVCSTDFSGQPTYTYNKAGKLSTYDDGVEKNLFTNSYDAAGRLQTLTSSWNDSLHPPTLFTAHTYNPAGGLTSALYGTGLTVTRTYDPRLRITSETDGPQFSTPPPVTINIVGSERFLLGSEQIQ